jgi:hypothetical protein
MTPGTETGGPGRCQMASQHLHECKPRLGAAPGADAWAMAMLEGGVTDEL